MKTISGPKGRRAILFQNAVRNVRRREHSEPRNVRVVAEADSRGPVDAQASGPVKDMQARLEAAFDGKDAA